MSNELILEALASDLKRVALGLGRNSYDMAKRFSQEALTRKHEIDQKKLDPYLVKILTKTEHVLRDLGRERTAEDVLMYSTLLQNFTRQRRDAQNV